MKALLLNGARDNDELVATAHELIVAELDRAAWDVNAMMLRDLKIADCRGCFECWLKTPGECVIDDAARGIARNMVQSELVIFLTPVTFGGYSSKLKKAVDRFIPNITPFFATVNGETHHQKRYERYANFLAVGTLPRPDEESERIFKTLAERNAINMHSPAHAVGVLYGTQDAEEQRAQIKSWLARVEVGK